MFVLYTWQDTPSWFFGITRRSFATLGKFNTYDDACDYAFNICGFTTIEDFFISWEDIETQQLWSDFDTIEDLSTNCKGAS